MQADKNTNRVVELFIILISSLLFAWLSFHVHAGKTFAMDDAVFKITFSMRSNFMNGLMQVFTFLGSSYFLLPANIVLICWILIWKKDSLFALQWTVTAIGSLLLMYFFKGFYQRPRPMDPYLTAATGFSFPSGHTLNSLVFFGLIIILLWRFFSKSSLRFWGTFLLGILIIAIGLSRNYLRVHYASDVFGGLSLGLSWLLLVNLIFQIIFQRRQNERDIKIE